MEHVRALCIAQARMRLAGWGDGGDDGDDARAAALDALHELRDAAPGAVRQLLVRALMALGEELRSRGDELP